MSKRPVVLMARNLMPEAECSICGKPATHLCMECVYEDQNSGLLCNAHKKNHPHKNYGKPIELVNSTRVGMCGYTGPADPHNAISESHSHFEMIRPERKVGFAFSFS